MRKSVLILLSCAALLVSALPALATNGDNLMGVGPISRSMGGVGVAAPQDAISAIFTNPASMCFGPYCPGSESDFAGTIFSPTVKAKVTLMTPVGPMVLSGKSQHPFFMIPAVAVTSPVSDTLRIGVGLFGVSGLGVDYRNKGWDLDGNPGNGAEGDMYTKLEIMKFAPNLAYKVTPDLSIGATLQIVYGNLDLGQGGSHNYTVGGQFGLLYKSGPMQFGLTYTTPETIEHKRVMNFDAAFGSLNQDTLKLEAPQNVAAGLSWQVSPELLIEGDVKWYNWADAKGYKEFDWENQFVYAAGLQYKVMPGLALRAGYNYSKNPVKEHNGWNPMTATTVQGKTMPTFGYEYFRIIGFPAIVEQHISCGLGYMITPRVELNLEYSHAFEKTMSEKAIQGAVKLQSTLSEDSYSFGVNWKF